MIVYDAKSVGSTCERSADGLARQNAVVVGFARLVLRALGIAGALILARALAAVTIVGVTAEAR